MAYWRRRLERRVFLLAMVCSFVFLTGQFALMTAEDCWVTALDIAHIFTAILHTLDSPKKNALNDLFVRQPFGRREDKH